MAIVQISRITNRKGLTENLPQLAGAELGWCTDSRRLFIGNGTAEEGAPVIGNTEILTEYSNFVEVIDYVYSDAVVGYPAQTGPTSSDPVVRTIQEKLDDTASVRDFGAVGDGIADDTDAIERALYQLFCRASNTQIRRSLFFPAGTYRTTREIRIPTWATLIGEGADHSIIFMDSSSTSSYIARFVDSQNQTGSNIGNNGAVPPRSIEISSMTFQSESLSDILLVDSAQDCWFSSVAFRGPLTVDQLIAMSPGANDHAGVRFSSTPSVISQQINFDKCIFSGITTGIKTAVQLEGVTVSNSRFDTLYYGVDISGSVSGFRTVHNFFDNVYAEGIKYDSGLNISANNIFYNVGNALGNNPEYSVIVFGTDNNLSVSDLFARTDDEAINVPRIAFGTILTSTGGSGIQLGRYARDNGRTAQLVDGQATNATIFTVSSLDIAAINVDYTIVRGTTKRTGRITFMPQGLNDVTYSDEFVANDDDGITLFAMLGVDPNTISLDYNSTYTGTPATMTYSITHLA